VSASRPNPTDAELADTIEAEQLRRARKRRRLVVVNYAHADAATLDEPAAQPLLARLGAACAYVSDDVDRLTHVQGVALDVLAARARPRCPQPQEET